MSRKTVKLICEIEVPFESYGKPSLDQRAGRFIRKWIKESLDSELSYIPLYVEKDKGGAWIEDNSKKTRIKVTLSRVTVG